VLRRNRVHCVMLKMGQNCERDKWHLEASVLSRCYSVDLYRRKLHSGHIRLNCKFKVSVKDYDL
jgi:hypothetical protein